MTNSNLLPRGVFDGTYPFPQIHIYADLPATSWAGPSEPSERLSPGLQSSVSPQIELKPIYEKEFVAQSYKEVLYSKDN